MKVDKKKSKPWKPTPSQRRAKALLHKYCSESTLRSLTVDDSELPRYVSPIPVALVRKWSREQKDFWTWFLTPVECDAKFYEAKELAYSFLVEILSLDTLTPSGQIDSEVVKAKMKAVDYLITKSSTPMVQVQNNTLNAPASSLPPGAVPRGLKGKDARVVGRQIAALEAASDSTIDLLEEDETYEA